MIHALPGPDDDELWIRAVAVDVTDDAATTTLVRNVVARSGVGGMIETVSNDALFEFELEQVDVARWLDIEQPTPSATDGAQHNPDETAAPGAEVPDWHAPRLDGPRS